MMAAPFEHTLRRISPAIIVDVETGGLTPSVDALLQVAVGVVLDGELVETASVRIIPREGSWIAPEAAAVVGFESHAQWKECGALPEREALGEIQRKVGRLVPQRGRCTWIGHNTPYDRAFLDRARMGMAWADLAALGYLDRKFLDRVRAGTEAGLQDLCHHRDIDTMALATIAQAAGIVESRSLDALGRAAGFCRSSQTVHDAVEDVQLTWEVLKWLLSHLRWTP